MNSKELVRAAFAAIFLVASTATPWAGAQQPALEQCPFEARELATVFGVEFSAVHPEADLELDGGVVLRSCRYESKTLQFRVVANHYVKDPAQAKLERQESHARDRVMPIAKDADGAAHIEVRKGKPTPTLHYARRGVGVTLLLFGPDLEPVRASASVLADLRSKLASVRRIP